MSLVYPKKRISYLFIPRCLNTAVLFWVLENYYLARFDVISGKLNVVKYVYSSSVTRLEEIDSPDLYVLSDELNGGYYQWTIHICSYENSPTCLLLCHFQQWWQLEGYNYILITNLRCIVFHSRKFRLHVLLNIYRAVCSHKIPCNSKQVNQWITRCVIYFSTASARLWDDAILCKRRLVMMCT